MKFTLGNYYPASSLVHRLDPRTKILVSVWLMILLFVFSSPLAMAAYGLALLSLIALARVPLGLVLRTLRPIALLAALAFVVNTLTGGPPELWRIGPIAISQPGLDTGLRMALRLFYLILTTQLLLTLTTTPILIADGLEALLKPFARFGFPAHELAMMMSIALRFVPTLAEETDKIMKAQSSRGADYDTGGAFARARGLVSVLVPLFASALKRADELATAMEARCYRGGDGRTKLRQLQLGRLDLLFVLIVVVLTRRSWSSNMSCASESDRLERAAGSDVGESSGVRGLPPGLVLDATTERLLPRPFVRPDESRDRGRAPAGRRRLVLVTAYDGSDWAGWQWQANAPSLQGELERVLSRLSGEAIRVVGCSRTDAGVHAACHVSHFDTSWSIPAERLPLALSGQLAPSIKVLHGGEAAPDFHSRFDCAEKTYAYQIWNARLPSPFAARWSARVPQPLDVERMAAACPALVGEHDFTSFRAAGSEVLTSTRTLTDVHIECPAPGNGPLPLLSPVEAAQGRLIRIVVSGSGFLYNMMRIIAGTLVAVGEGILEPEALAAIIAARDRLAAGRTMPASGLILERVRYRATAPGTACTPPPLRAD